MLYRTWAAFLVAVLLVTSCGPNDDTWVEVDFLWVRTENNIPTEGGSTHARLEAQRSSRGMFVGIFESTAGGTGDMWRAAVWVAAITGTLTLQKNPLDYRYLVETESGGRVDGPSAGALFAVAIMASLRGDTLSADATMTGTINPDGTIGPVGGVPQKMKAVAKNGKKRFCYPVGQRYEPDAASGKMLDLETLAGELGIEAREVEDLHQAYSCLTGSEIPRIDPINRTAMQLSPEATELLRSMSEEWLKSSKEAYNMSRELTTGNLFEDLWDSAEKQFDDARSLLDQGLVAAGYSKSVEVYVNCRTLVIMSAVVDQLHKGNPDEALDVFNQMDRSSMESVKKVFDELAKNQPDTINRTIVALDAYEAAITAVVSREWARALYSDAVQQMTKAAKKGASDKKMLELFSSFVKPLSEIALVGVDARLALDLLQIFRLEDSSRKVKLAHVDDVAKVYLGAASANVEYFDSIIVKERAEAYGRSQEAVRTDMLEEESSYRTALLNLRLPEAGKLGFAEEGVPASLARLAGAMSSYFASSVLVARYYSLGATKNKAGEMNVAREKALIASLSLAEEKARENAAWALKLIGRIPESAKICYQTGLVLRDRRSYEDKLAALEQFWRSSAWSQAAVLLARLGEDD